VTTKTYATCITNPYITAANYKQKRCTRATPQLSVIKYSIVHDVSSVTAWTFQRYIQQEQFLARLHGQKTVTRLYDLMSAGGMLQRQTAMPEWLIKVHSCIVRRNWDPVTVKFVHIKVVHYSLVTHMTQILVFRCFSWNYRNRHSTITQLLIKR